MAHCNCKNKTFQSYCVASGYCNPHIDSLNLNSFAVPVFDIHMCVEFTRHYSPILCEWQMTSHPEDGQESEAEALQKHVPWTMGKGCWWLIFWAKPEVGVVLFLYLPLARTFLFESIFFCIIYYFFILSKWLNIHIPMVYRCKIYGWYGCTWPLAINQGYILTWCVGVCGWFPMFG